MKKEALFLWREIRCRAALFLIIASEGRCRWQVPQVMAKEIVSNNSASYGDGGGLLSLIESDGARGYSEISLSESGSQKEMHESIPDKLKEM